MPPSGRNSETASSKMPKSASSSSSIPPANTPTLDPSLDTAHRIPPRKPRSNPDPTHNTLPGQIHSKSPESRRNSSKSSSNSAVDVAAEDAGSVASLEVELPTVGVVQFADESCYLGQHVGQKRTGLGICVFPTLDLYQGTWHGGVKHGLGCYLFASTKNRFEGEFFQDAIQGRGRFLWADGSVHIGDFVDHRPHGLALFQASDGSTYLGQFEAGKFSGYGVLYYPNGDIYVGEFANDKRQGTGAYTFVNQYRTKVDAGHWFEDTLLTLSPDADVAVKAAQQRGEDVMQRVVDLVDFVQNEVLRAVNQARRGLELPSVLKNLDTLQEEVLEEAAAALKSPQPPKRAPPIPTSVPAASTTPAPAPETSSSTVRTNRGRTVSSIDSKEWLDCEELNDKEDDTPQPVTQQTTPPPPQSMPRKQEEEEDGEVEGGLGLSPKRSVSGAQPYLRFGSEVVEGGGLLEQAQESCGEEKRSLWFETRHVPRRVQSIRSFIDKKFGEKRGGFGSGSGAGIRRQRQRAGQGVQGGDSLPMPRLSNAQGNRLWQVLYAEQSMEASQAERPRGQPVGSSSRSRASTRRTSSRASRSSGGAVPNENDETESDHRPGVGEVAGSRRASTLERLQGRGGDARNVLATGREFTLDDLPAPSPAPVAPTDEAGGVNAQPELVRAEEDLPGQRNTDVLWSSQELEQKSYQSQGIRTLTLTPTPTQGGSRVEADVGSTPLNSLPLDALEQEHTGTEEEECKSEPPEATPIVEDKGDASSVYGEHVVKPSRPQQSPPMLPKPHIPRVAPPSAPLRPPYPPKAIDPRPPRREPYAPSGNPKPPRRPPYPPK